MEWVRWFEPITPDVWLQTLIVALLAFLLLTGMVAYWPARFPGALTPEERALRRQSFLVRWALNLGLAALGAASAAAAFLLLAPPRQPVDLVLSSRLRPDAEPASDLSARDRVQLDLGPVVDAVLEACRRRGAPNWVRGDASERAAARLAFLEAVAQTEPAESSPGQRWERTLPPWLVLSVEVSVVRWALRRHNVVATRVAPGPARGDSEGWPLAALLLTGRTGRVTCVNLLPLPSNGFTVRRLTGVWLDRQTHKLEAWAVVDGRFPHQKAPAQTLSFRLIAGGKDFVKPLTQELSADFPAESRIVAMTWTVDDAPEESPLTLADETGRCTAGVRVRTQAPPPAEIGLLPQTSADWKKALARFLTAEKAELEAFTSELATLGLEVPRPVAVREGIPVLLAADEVAVIAGQRAIAERVHAQLRREGKGSTTAQVGRVVATRLEPGTVFSWLALPVASTGAGTSNMRREPLVVAEPAGAELSQGRAPPANTVQEVFVEVGRDGKDRYVVFRGAAATPPVPGESLRFLAQVRSLAWAVRYLTGGESDLLGADSLRPGPTTTDAVAGPFLNEPDLQREVARRLAWRDQTAIMVIGFFLALLAWRILRNTPAT